MTGHILPNPQYPIHNIHHALHVLLFSLTLTLLITGVVSAQDLTPIVPDDAVNEIAKDMYCPVCENIPLDVCGTQACIQWRELIRQRLAEGWTEEQIKVYFVQQYGDRVLAEPPRRGLNLLVYLVPPIVVLIGLVLVFQVVRSWNVPLLKPGSRTRIHIPPTTQEGRSPQGEFVEEEYMRRLEEELSRRG